MTLNSQTGRSTMKKTLLITSLAAVAVAAPLAGASGTGSHHSPASQHAGSKPGIAGGANGALLAGAKPGVAAGSNAVLIGSKPGVASGSNALFVGGKVTGSDFRD
jgi:hypothetical protein